MPISPNPGSEHSHTYFVEDSSNEDERTRIHLQSQMLTASMGGVLAEQPDPAGLQSILDIGCGTGEWLIDVARTYPTISRLIGIDVNPKTLDYARAMAEEEQVNKRVEFVTMDALHALDFPSGFFDLVNQRFGFSYLRKWDWPNLMNELWRVIRKEGVIRLTEPDIVGESNSPALARLGQIQLKAFQQAGYFFKPEDHGVISELPHLLTQRGLQKVQTRLYMAEYPAGTPQGQLFYEDMKHLFRTAVPFYRKWTALPKDYEELVQQMLVEIQQPDFKATVKLLTAWGIKEN